MDDLFSNGENLDWKLIHEKKTKADVIKLILCARFFFLNILIFIFVNQTRFYVVKLQKLWSNLRSNNPLVMLLSVYVEKLAVYVVLEIIKE